MPFGSSSGFLGGVFGANISFSWLVPRFTVGQQRFDGYLVPEGFRKPGVGCIQTFGKHRFSLKAPARY